MKKKWLIYNWSCKKTRYKQYEIEIDFYSTNKFYVLSMIIVENFFFVI